MKLELYEKVAGGDDIFSQSYLISSNEAKLKKNLKISKKVFQ